MRVLLDTHALIWYSIDDPELSRRAKSAIEDPDHTVLVSAATAWEISTKYRLGKLPLAQLLAMELAGYVVEQGFQSLPVSLSHGLRAGALPGPHKDPFDRMLIAQAQAEGIPLVSNETIFDEYGVTRIW